jgi:hypothetical protein
MLVNLLFTSLTPLEKDLSFVSITPLEKISLIINFLTLIIIKE